MVEQSSIVNEVTVELQGQRWLRDFLGYLVVGGLAFVVDFGVYSALFFWGHADPLVAAPCAFALGLCVNYGLATRFVFREHRLDNRSLEFLAYAAIGLTGLCLNELVIYLAFDLLHVPAISSKVLATATVFMFNFVARRTLLFSKVANG